MLKSFLCFLEKISPKLVAKVALFVMTNPQQRKIRTFEKDILTLAKIDRISFKQFSIATYEWGEGDTSILLVHGWEGRASNFGKIIPLLLKKGYKVKSFDAPSHGNSSRQKVNFFDYIQLVKQVLQKQHFQHIMAHSMGSVITIGALAEIPSYPLKQLVLLTTPDRLTDYTQSLMEQLGLGTKTEKVLLHLIKEQTGKDPHLINGSDLCQTIETERGLIIQDTADQIIPLAWSKRVQQNLPNTALVEIENTGHFKMLWAETTLDILDEWLDANH